MDKKLSENDVKRGFIRIPSGVWKGLTEADAGSTVLEIQPPFPGYMQAAKLDKLQRVWCKEIGKLKPGTEYYVTREGRRIIVQTNTEPRPQPVAEQQPEPLKASGSPQVPASPTATGETPATRPEKRQGRRGAAKPFPTPVEGAP